MSIKHTQGNVATINNVLNKLLTDAAFCEQFEKNRKAALETLALTVADYEALMALDYTEFLAAAKVIRAIRADCIK